MQEKIPDPRRSHMPRGNKACEPQLLSLCSGTQELQLRKPTSPRTCVPQEKPQEPCASQLESNPCVLQLEKNLYSSEDPAQPKIKKMIFLTLIEESK